MEANRTKVFHSLRDIPVRSADVIPILQSDGNTRRVDFPTGGYHGMARGEGFGETIDTGRRAAGLGRGKVDRRSKLRQVKRGVTLVDFALLGGWVVFAIYLGVQWVRA